MAKSSPTLRFGLIGASDIAATRIIPALRRRGDSVVGLVSSSREWGQQYAQEHGIEFVTTELDALLARQDLDAVYVSTTNDLHHEQVLAAASAGAHVLCEKPLAMTVDDAWAMVDACERAGVLLATNHHLPAAGTHRAIQRLAADGTLGRLLAVRIFHADDLPARLRGWRLTDPARGGGVVLDNTTHDAAAVHAILRVAPLEATAITARQGPWEATSEDAAMSIIRYEGDILVQTHDAFTLPCARTGLEVHGTEGSIYATDIMDQDPVGNIILRSASGERTIEPVDRRDLYDVGLEAFAAAVAGDGEPIVTGVDGVRALAVAKAVLDASTTGRTVQIGWDRHATRS